MRRFLCVLTLTAAAILPGISGFADTESDSSSDISILEDASYEFLIYARLIGGESADSLWDMEMSRKTISGRAVTVRLEGEQIVVLAQFTPYQQDEEQILLVAQGQTWLSQHNEEGVRYRTAFKSLPLKLGESLFFFPLGYNFSDESSDGTNLEIEIQFHKVQEQADE